MITEASSLYRTILKFIGHPSDELESATEILPKSPLKIVCMGQTNSGKSSFVNYFTGHAILPVSAEQRTNTIPIIIESCNSSKFIGEAHHPLHDDNKRMEATSRKKFTDWIESWNRKGGTRYMRLQVPRNESLPDGVVIIDLPGVEGFSGEVAESAPARDAAYWTHMCLESADIVVFFSRYDRTRTQEIEFLNHSKARKKTFLLTHCDMFINPGADTDEIDLLGSRFRHIKEFLQKCESDKNIEMHFPQTQSLLKTATEKLSGEFDEKRVSYHLQQLDSFVEETRNRFNRMFDQIFPITNIGSLEDMTVAGAITKKAISGKTQASHWIRDVCVSLKEGTAICRDPALLHDTVESKARRWMSEHNEKVSSLERQLSKSENKFLERKSRVIKIIRRADTEFCHRHPLGNAVDVYCNKVKSGLLKTFLRVFHSPRQVFTDESKMVANINAEIQNIQSEIEVGITAAAAGIRIEYGPVKFDPHKMKNKDADEILETLSKEITTSFLKDDIEEKFDQSDMGREIQELKRQLSDERNRQNEIRSLTEKLSELRPYFPECTS